MYDTKFLFLVLWTEAYSVIICFNYLFLQMSLLFRRETD